MILAALLALALAMAAQGPHPVPVNFQDTSFTTTDGVRLHVLEAGQGRPGEPVVAFVPGWSMPASIWRRQLEALAATHRVVALDPRGQGKSEVPPGGYTTERRAEDIHEFVARHAPVVLVAWSLGALEALQYVHAHGDAALAALVIVDSSVGEGPAPAPRDPAVPGFQDELKRDRAAVVDGFVRAMFRTPQRDADLVALREAALRMPLDASLSLFPGERIPREHWREIARAFRKPLLYAVTPQFAGQAESLRRNRPATRVELFEGSGHALFVDDPVRFSALLEDFIRRNKQMPAAAD
ncbi:MAG: alpha/beta hydrolase [Proteobacteria bacterium]|nr:alpha/beta hydrolase [Pseudomonadota bacterium]